MLLEELNTIRKARKFKMSSAITCTIKGSFKKTDTFFERCLNFIKLGRLDYYGKLGVEKLKANTPIDTGLLASSWYYKIRRHKGSASIIFCNDDIEGGMNVALMIQYGHGTKSGIWIPGRDYITPAITELLLEVANDMREEIQSL